jgi:hypothetical protein
MDDGRGFDYHTTEDLRLFTRLWRAFKTASQMIQDRVSRLGINPKHFLISNYHFQGYELSDEEVNISFEKFVIDHRDSASGKPE